MGFVAHVIEANQHFLKQDNGIPIERHFDELLH
jgi:hypothetical protein